VPRDDDADFFVALNADAEVVRHTGDGAFESREDALTTIRLLRERLDRTGVTRWVVREADVPIGWCGLKWSGVRPVDERACARMAEAAE
jgi:hypothetical protein